MKIPAQAIFRQKAVIAKNSDTVTTQIAQKTTQAKEPKKPPNKYTGGAFAVISVLGLVKLADAFDAITHQKPRK